MPHSLSLADRKRIVDANYGRDFGWHVLSPADIALATLSEWKDISYLVTPLDGHHETLTADFWYPDCHRLRNLSYPEFIVDVFGHLHSETNRVTFRYDYICVDFGWLDHLRSPLWFLLRSW